MFISRNDDAAPRSIFKLAETKEPLDGNIVDTKIVFAFTKVTVSTSS